MPAPPVVDIDLAAFAADPYPTYARLRRDAPVAHVPQLGAVLLTRRDDIWHWEKQIDVFSSLQPGGLMTRLMGENMMRKDGSAHLAERKLFMPAVSPRAVQDVWLARFRAHADRLLADLAPRASADLMADFALLFAGECLKDVTGLTQVAAQDMDAWSQAMIAGIANYAGDPAIEARCIAATTAIDAAIDARLAAGGGTPDDPSLLGVLRSGGMPLDNIRHNIKLTISGGQNEPRKAIAGTIWALLTHPEHRAAAMAGTLPWGRVFDEYIRWISPIGMSPRRIARPVEIHGYHLEPDMRAFLMFAAANRDEAHFDAPNQFDPHRDTFKAIGFGAGPHFCAGAWVSKAMIAQIALPHVFERLPALRLASGAEPRCAGWAFRGLTDLPVVWDAR